MPTAIQGVARLGDRLERLASQARAAQAELSRVKPLTPAEQEQVTKSATTQADELLRQLADAQLTTV